MTKHIGVIIVWIVIAGIVLYAVQNFDALLDGITYVRQSIDAQSIPEAVERLFSQ